MTRAMRAACSYCAAHPLRPTQRVEQALVVRPLDVHEPCVGRQQKWMDAHLIQRRQVACAQRHPFDVGQRESGQCVFGPFAEKLLKAGILLQAEDEFLDAIDAHFADFRCCLSASLKRLRSRTSPMSLWTRYSDVSAIPLPCDSRIVSSWSITCHILRSSLTCHSAFQSHHFHPAILRLRTM